MPRVAWALLAACTICVACVDGTTPKCDTVDSGCYPGDASATSDAAATSDASQLGEGGQPDASDASSDASSAVDAPAD